MLSRSVGSGVADRVERAFDQLLPLLADVVIDRTHRLDGAGGWSCEGKFAIDDFALVKSERAVTENYKTAVCERARFILVEIEDDFFIGKIITRDFHDGRGVMDF